MGTMVALQAGSMVLGASQAAQQQELQNAQLDAQKTVGMANIDAQNLIADANAAAANSVRGANNTLQAAQAALANFNNSASNYWKMQAAGAKYNASVTNSLRIQDKAVQGTLETRLREAEQLGAIQAQAATTGTGGTSSMMLQNALYGLTARALTRQDEALKETSYDALVQRAGLMSGAITSLNQGQTFAPLDFTQNVAQQVVSPVWAADYEQSASSAATSYLFKGLAGNVGQVLANSKLFGNSLDTEFSGPSTYYSIGGTSNAAGDGYGLAGIGTL